MSPNTSIIKPFWPLSAAIRITTDLTWRVAETLFALPFFSRLSDGRCALCFCNPLHVKDINEHLAFVLCLLNLLAAMLLWPAKLSPVFR